MAMMEGLKLDFAGFRPTATVSNEIREMASRLFMSAPSDSVTRATIRKVRRGTEEVFEGILRISSSVGVFLAQEVDTDVLRLADRLKDRIGGQLSAWKQERLV